MTWFTVTVNCTLVVSTPPFCVPPSSITVTVMVAVPKLFAAGVKVNVPVEFGLVYVIDRVDEGGVVRGGRDRQGLGLAAAGRDPREVDGLLARVLIDRHVRGRVDRRRVVDVVIQPAVDVLAAACRTGLALPDEDGVAVGVGGNFGAVWLSPDWVDGRNWVGPISVPPELTRWARIVASDDAVPPWP